MSHSPAERTEEDLDNIFEELQNVRAFGHLSNAVSTNAHMHMHMHAHTHVTHTHQVKRELAACVLLEHHQKAGKFCKLLPVLTVRLKWREGGEGGMEGRREGEKEREG